MTACTIEICRVVFSLAANERVQDRRDGKWSSVGTWPPRGPGYFFPNLIFYFPCNVAEEQRAEAHRQQSALMQHLNKTSHIRQVFDFNNALSTERSAENVVKKWALRWRNTNSVGTESKREKQRKWGQLVQQSRRKEIETLWKRRLKPKRIAVTSADFFQFATRVFSRFLEGRRQEEYGVRYSEAKREIERDRVPEHLLMQVFRQRLPTRIEVGPELWTCLDVPCTVRSKQAVERKTHRKRNLLSFYKIEVKC